MWYDAPDNFFFFSYGQATNALLRNCEDLNVWAHATIIVKNNATDLLQDLL
jgi:hypothetical protein